MRELDGNIFGKDQPCFGCGPAHPHGFRLRVTEEGGEVITRVTPNERQQSAPGIMHGGLVFTLADELAGWAVIAQLGKFGFTARFAGKLQRPARIGRELLGRARIVRKTSRTAEVEATLAQDGEQVFAGTFTFAILDRGGAEKLLGGPLPEEWLPFAR
jgi:acyl-coenzyme A thioesterase PaaI-like protein